MAVNPSVTAEIVDENKICNDDEQKQHLEGIGKVMETMQGAVAGAYQKMAQSLQTSTMMIEKMNSYLEDYLCKSLAVEATTQIKDVETPNAKQESPGLVLYVTLHNRSKIPIKDIRVNIWTIPGMELEVSNRSCEELTANSRRNLEFPLSRDSLMKLIQKDVKLKVSFPSPGTARMLTNNNTTKIYYSNHCTISISSEANPLLDEQQVIVGDIPASVLRSYLQISPFKALQTSTEYYEVHDPLIVDAPNVVACLQILETSVENESCKVAVFASDRLVLCFLKDEFETLKKIKHQYS